MNWIEFNKSFNEFTRMGANIAGALIEVSIGDGRRKIILIGDINPFANADDGKKLLNDDAIVLRYKYVWGRVGKPL